VSAIGSKDASRADMNAQYPCVLNLDPPDRFERTHVFLRMLALIALGIMGVPLGALAALAYVFLPLIAAAEISARKERYLTEFAPKMIDVVQLIVDALAYLMLLTDRIPRYRAGTAELEIELGGEPTVKSALLRLLFALPEAIALVILAIVSGFLWVLAALAVLAFEQYPAPIFAFQRGMLRWMTRLLVYLASMVDRYPPFAIEMRRESNATRS
jgi:hypothetical protein